MILTLNLLLLKKGTKPILQPTCPACIVNSQIVAFVQISDCQQITEVPEINK